MTEIEFDNWVFEHGIKPHTEKLSDRFAIMIRSAGYREEGAMLPVDMPVQSSTPKWTCQSNENPSVI